MRCARMLGFCAVCAVIYACSPGTDSIAEDDATVITGVGGANSAVSSSASTAATTSSATGAGGAAGQGGAGGGNCPDMVFSEPNQSEDTAYKLQSQPIDECDSNGDSISGTLAGATDADWFYYEGDNNATLCFVDPGRMLTQSEGGARLCKYFECKNGVVNTTVTCPSGSTSAMSPNSRPGCCATGSFTIGFQDVNCTGSVDDDMFVYIRLDQPSANASTCNDYTLSYHF